MQFLLNTKPISIAARRTCLGIFYLELALASPGHRRAPKNSHRPSQQISKFSTFHTKLIKLRKSHWTPRTQPGAKWILDLCTKISFWKASDASPCEATWTGLSMVLVPDSQGLNDRVEKQMSKKMHH